MGYPGEQEHVDYLDYLEQHAMKSSTKGPAMTKPEWRAWRLAQQQAAKPKPPPRTAADY